jgi:hypothetical protein
MPHSPGYAYYHISYNVPLPNFAALGDLVKMAPTTVLASEVPDSELEHYESI